MKLKISYITILFLGLALSVSAQRRKHKSVKHPATHTAHKKAQPKAAHAVTKKGKIKTKGNDVAVKDSATLKGATIEILQSYKPEVKLSAKPEATPSLPPVDISTPAQTYNVPAQSMYYTYNSLPLRPLALGKDSVERGYENYVKVGGGNLSTILLDAGFAGLHGSNYETAIQVHHLSQAGNALAQKTALTSIDAEGTLHTAKNDLHAGISGYRNLYNLYGFELPANVVSKVYSGFKIGVDLTPSASQRKAFSYHPKIGFGLHNDNYGSSEKMLSVELPFTYKQSEDLNFYCAVNGVYDVLSRTAMNNVQSNMLQIAPGVEYKSGSFSSKIGLSPTVGATNVYLLPDIDARYAIKNTQLSIFAGWKGVLNRNNYESLSTWNPYVYFRYSLQQTHANEIYGGVQTNIGNHLALSGQVSYWLYDNMLMFVNDTTYSKKDMLPVYDKVNAMTLTASVRYHIGNVLAIDVSGTYTAFDPEHFKHAWQEPGVRFNAGLMVRPIPQLTVTGYLSVMDELYALDNGNRSVKMDGAFDLGGSAEYNFIPRLSAFIQINNILNNHYERWYGYQAYGFNIFGGIRFKF